MLKFRTMRPSRRLSPLEWWDFGERRSTRR